MTRLLSLPILGLALTLILWAGFDHIDDLPTWQLIAAVVLGAWGIGPWVDDDTHYYEVHARVIPRGRWR